MLPHPMLLLIRIMFNFLFAALLNGGIDRIESQSTPSGLGFPEDLYCSDITDISPGPAWEGMTIGESSRSEFELFINRLSSDYQSVEREGMLIFFVFDRNKAILQHIPPLITSCFVDETLVLLDVHLDETLSQPYLADMIAQYGVPDAVTWTSTLGTRVGFWFQQGIAVEVSIRQEPAGNYGKVIRIVFFPYQASDNYAENWPYNRTLETAIIGDVVYEPVLPEEQNPFDFDMMLATITAEPPRTPTPTLRPTSP